MSLVPLLLGDWWDEWERPSRLLDQRFGDVLSREELFHSPAALLRPRGYLRPWRSQLHPRPSTLGRDSDKLEVVLEVEGFRPSELSVRAVERTIVVEGKHGERADHQGLISRHFVRKYLLPPDADPSALVSTLSADGLLTITAPRKTGEDSAERVVPIIQTGAPAIKPSIETNIKIEHVN